jgi:hypothetical protein
MAPLQVGLLETPRALDPPAAKSLIDSHSP